MSANNKLNHIKLKTLNYIDLIGAKNKLEPCPVPSNHNNYFVHIKDKQLSKDFWVNDQKIKIGIVRTTNKE